MQLAAESDSLVLFTDGANAVHVITSGRREPAVDVVLDVPRVPVVDTVGAGDSFSGGFLAWWMHDGLGRDDLADVDKVVAAARFGIAVAGVTCQRPGADPPHAAEVPGDGRERDARRVHALPGDGLGDRRRAREPDDLARRGLRRSSTTPTPTSKPELYRLLWMAHGWLYVIYLVVGVDLAFRVRYSVPQHAGDPHRRARSRSRRSSPRPPSTRTS